MMELEAALLEIGRVDGRLLSSPARPSWEFAMRMRGISQSCENAGVPVRSEDLSAWVSRGGIPPRHSEGINDDISVAAIAFQVNELWKSGARILKPDQPTRVDAFFGYRRRAFEYAGDDARFYRALVADVFEDNRSLKKPETITDIAKNCEKLLAVYGSILDQRVATHSGVQGLVGARVRPVVWLVAAHVPGLLQSAGLTANLHLNLVPSIRDRDCSAAVIETHIRDRIAVEGIASRRLLDEFEREIRNLTSTVTTKRSRSQMAASVLCAMPEIRSNLLAQAIGSTPQGAGYIRRRMNM